MFFGGGSQIGSGGITLADALGSSPSTGVRIGRNTFDSLKLERYANSRSVANGQEVNVSGSLLMSISDNLVTSTGANAGAAMGASTLYYIYISNGIATYAPNTFRGSTTAPSLVEGVYYLGTSGNALNWRFLAWVATDAANEFRDDDTARLVVNYYNRRPLRLFTCPGYVDDGAQTTYALNKAVFGPINGGTDDAVSFIATGEDAAWFGSVAHFTAVGASTAYVGIGIDSTTQPLMVGACRSTGQSTTAAGTTTQAVGVRTVNMLGCTQGTAYTVAADTLRLGAAADPAATYLFGWCMG